MYYLTSPHLDTKALFENFHTSTYTLGYYKQNEIGSRRIAAVRVCLHWWQVVQNYVKLRWLFFV